MRKFPKQRNPYPVVDSIIYSGNKVLLVQRTEPIPGLWAVPGGFVDWGETFEAAAIREAKEETGLDIKVTDILGAYSDPTRDPRGHLVAVVFIAKKIGGKLKISHEHSDIKWFDLKNIDSLKELHSDHIKVLKDFLKWKKKRGTYWSSK